MAATIPEEPVTAPRHPGFHGRLVDPKFRLHVRQYVLQCIAATVVVFLVLSVLDAFRQTVLVAALGASAFIAFTMPWVNASRPRYLLGGYLVGIVVGCAVSALSATVSVHSATTLVGVVPLAFAAFATGLALFIMVVIDTEHPPAAGLALGFVLNDWDLATVLVVFAGIAAISLIKEVLKPRMMDLL